MNILIIFPMMTFVSICYLLLSCYVQGILWSHYNSYLPLVSKGSQEIPEAATFTFVIVIVGLMSLITGLIRYYQIVAIVHDRRFFFSLARYYDFKPTEPSLVTSLHSCIVCLNHTSLSSSLAIFIGLILTGAFRLHESHLFHDLAAGMVFAGCLVFMVIQVYISWILIKLVNTRWMYHARLVITISAVISLALFLVHSALTLDAHRMPFWGASQPGELMISLNEWIFLLATAAFMLTFVQDFSRLTVLELQMSYAFTSPLPSTDNTVTVMNQSRI